MDVSPTAVHCLQERAARRVPLVAAVRRAVPRPEPGVRLHVPLLPRLEDPLRRAHVSPARGDTGAAPGATTPEGDAFSLCKSMDIGSTQRPLTRADSQSSRDTSSDEESPRSRWTRSCDLKEAVNRTSAGGVQISLCCHKAAVCVGMRAV